MKETYASLRVRSLDFFKFDDKLCLNSSLIFDIFEEKMHKKTVLEDIV